MLQVIVQSDGGRGKSTIAALIAQKLTDVGIPVVIVDMDTHNAVDLLSDPERLRANTASIAGREKACGGKVGIRTQQIQKPPKSNVPHPLLFQCDFAAVFASDWTRLNREPGDGTRRPHIVPLTNDAIEFTKYQLNKPINDGNDNVFGPMYTGFGHINIADGVDDLLAFRLKPSSVDDIRAALNRVQAVFQVWKETL